MTVRTRFAPSPTGYLHIGGARTALFSWLYARKHGGTFILRIEDTDLERSTAESINAILEGMTWLGLEYDEGPFHQTHRFERYSQVKDQLLAEGKAYRCYCSKERLEQLREGQMARKEKPRYDGLCRHLKAPPPGAGDYVVRFKNPEEGVVVVEDQVRGRVVFQNSELDDLIIARTDHRGGGRPGYERQPRDSRRRSPQQHAAPDQYPQGPGRDPAAVCPCAHDPRRRRQASLQAPRGGERHAVSR